MSGSRNIGTEEQMMEGNVAAVLLSGKWTQTVAFPSQDQCLYNLYHSRLLKILDAVVEPPLWSSVQSS
jgi:hypothetical protein